jgi:hypothetical protein
LAQKPTRWWLLHNGKSCQPTWNLLHQLESSTMMLSLPECKKQSQILLPVLVQH